MNAEQPIGPAGLRRLAMRALERHCEALEARGTDGPLGVLASSDPSSGRSR